jgi:hypothetical protein
MCLISAIMIFLVLQIGNGIYRYSLISSKPNLKSGKIKVYVPVSTLASINLGTDASVRTEGVVKLDNFNQANMSKILRLADKVNGTYNILYDKKGIAHSPITLRLSLKYDESEFSRFMKRLHTKSIINYIAGYKDGRKCKWIMLNPTLARKSKTFH